MKAMQRGFAAALALAALLAAPALAAAPGSSDDVTVRVEYDDLDIHDPDGALVLYERLRHASARACEVGPYRVLGSLKRVRDAQDCYDELLDRFVAQVDSAELRKLHDS